MLVWALMVVPDATVNTSVVAYDSTAPVASNGVVTAAKPEETT